MVTVLIMCAGWAINTSDLPHTVQEVGACVRSLHESHPAAPWVYKLLDVLAANEEACAPWYSGINTGKFSFVKYHEAGRGSLPRKWVAAGDAAMKLNPVYGARSIFLMSFQNDVSERFPCVIAAAMFTGQGCTKVMLDAVALDSVLRRVPSSHDLPADFAIDYNKKAAARTESMWLVLILLVDWMMLTEYSRRHLSRDGNKANDYGWPSTEPIKGETLAKDEFIRNFGRHLVYVCREVCELSRYSFGTFFSAFPKKAEQRLCLYTLRMAASSSSGNGWCFAWRRAPTSSRRQSSPASRGVG